MEIKTYQSIIKRNSNSIRVLENSIREYYYLYHSATAIANHAINPTHQQVHEHSRKHFLKLAHKTKRDLKKLVDLQKALKAGIKNKIGSGV